MKQMILLLVGGLIILLIGCERGPISQTKSAMGTQVTISVYSWNELLNRMAMETAIDEAFKEIYRVQRLASWDRLKGLNDLAGYDEYDIGDELTQMINEAYDISEDTHGAFRPDIGPLVKLWGFEKDTIHIPEEPELDSVLTLINRTQFTILGYGLAYLEPVGASLDLSGYAKGYAVDKACEVLRKSGATSGIVEAGGDLRCFGVKPDGKPWRIAVRHPRKLEEFYTVLSLDSGAVATSGDYEQCVIVNDFRYHHIFDPETGFPARKSISATVVTSTCAQADGFATGMFVLGPENGVTIANSLQLDVLIIAEQGEKLIDARSDKFARLEVVPATDRNHSF